MSDFEKLLCVKRLSDQVLKFKVSGDFSLFEFADFMHLIKVDSKGDEARENVFTNEGFLLNQKLVRYADYPSILPHNNARSPLLKTVRKLKNPLILDLTCGTGKDSLEFLCAGYPVWSFERNFKSGFYFLAGLAKLWSDSDPGAQSLISKKFRFHLGDFLSFHHQSKFFCQELIEMQNKYEIVAYYDPMFFNKKGQKAKASIDLLETFNQERDRDQQEYFVNFRSHFKGRVIVKRHPKADEVFPGPTFKIQSKLVRFDVYERT